MKSTSYTITTTRQKIISSGPSSAYVYVHVTGNDAVYVGGADVTSANGLETQKHTSPIQFFIPRGNELWAITATGSIDVRVMTEGA